MENFSVLECKRRTCSTSSIAVLLLFLPNNDLLQQFEDYVIELRCEKGRRKGKKEKKISLY
jgi:hypothetical protein